MDRIIAISPGSELAWRYDRDQIAPERLMHSDKRVAEAAAARVAALMTEGHLLAIRRAAWMFEMGVQMDSDPDQASKLYEAAAILSQGQLS